MLIRLSRSFNVGDWIVHHGTNNIYQVVNVIDNQYQLKYGDTYTIQNRADVDRCARLWTIQDAKDGDVLCCKSGWTCIFKALGNDETFSSYCFMDKTKWFCKTGSECHTLDKAFIKAYYREIHPATKEQRDLLFAKMKEAGYEWDSEKKELKKIEMNTACSEEDELSYFENALFTAFSDAWQSYLLQGKVNVKQWAKEHSKELLEAAKEELKEQKYAWSEKDEKAINDIMWIIEAYRKNGFNETHIQMADSSETWLKSLKDRYTWKPSDEQMEFLQKFIKAYNEVTFPTEVRVLSSLYNDLKKLKG